MPHRMTKSDIVVQAVATSSLATTIVGWLPIICAVPAAIYYLILIIEKVSGKNFSEFFKRKTL